MVSAEVHVPNCIYRWPDYSIPNNEPTLMRSDLYTATIGGQVICLLPTKHSCCGTVHVSQGSPILGSLYCKAGRGSPACEEWLMNSVLVSFLLVSLLSL